MLEIKSLLIAIRPRHWSKNLLVFVVPFLAFALDNSVWISSVKIFLVFNLISSSIYLLNDCIDFESDRLHPIKKYRPIASGNLSRKKGLFFSIVLFIFSIYFASKINTYLFLVILIYYIIQILYCLILKNKPILDIFCVASGFLLRSIAGGIGVDLFISPWFLLSIGLLAIFICLEKRKAELRLFETNGVLTRKVLKKYSMPLLLRYENILTTGSFLTYALWASGPTLNGSSSKWMLLTVPLVLMGIFRYQLLSDPNLLNIRENKLTKISSENPVNILFKDNFIKFLILIWIISIIFISALTR